MSRRYHERLEYMAPCIGLDGLHENDAAVVILLLQNPDYKALAFLRGTALSVWLWTDRLLLLAMI